ncbi:beta-N-acetylglucosaminidase domain-containing protein [Streptomyces sp. NBC_00083]|uniref:beta-N-acetylglucosaminidase domain-containing protein n=1 Tax=Streptomyces sp. NBC_00083 TaxID=2975647 RepID=UPI002256954C|nr:beta-N-acetylglucosaminidase domain-containing protein [Streptomyces sp. NBC_00083]MCX5382401.1 beta-N-acetylglucosaminidase domain-containing protein [Streptomyces sp. NBC_00083]
MVDAASCGACGAAATVRAAPGSTTPDAVAPVEVWPRPRSLRSTGVPVEFAGAAVLLAAPGADPYAVRAVEDVLRAAGVRAPQRRLPGTGPVVRLGGPGAGDALRALGVPGPGGLPAGGYRIGVGRIAGRDTVALDGTGADGLFHAVQTLRQLIGKDERGRARVPGVVGRDWPATPVRGVTEGFYGESWSLRQRLDQLDFMARTKQNRYLYAAGDDPYRQARWREPYPAGQRAEFRALADRAARDHVTPGWAVAPGQELCLSSDADIAELNAKFDAMWALGMRAFQVQFQDVSYSEWHCAADAETFGSGPVAAARAHARVANAVAAHLAAAHPGAEPLSLLPTEYFEDGYTAYRGALADALAPDVQVAWTGVGVVPRTITGPQLARAKAVLGHALVTMDNYPVNDYAPRRIFLGPVTGRDPAVASGSAALLANAMRQPVASRIPLFTAADFAWNPGGYRPRESWRAAVDDLAGGDARVGEALTAVAANDASSVLGGPESAYLRPPAAAFWSARTAPEAAPVREDAARALRAAFTVLRETPQRLARTALAAELAPWLDQLARYGRAGELAVDLLQAQSAGDGAAAWRASLALDPLRSALKDAPVTVGAGVLDAFLDRAAREADAWTGADHPAVNVTTSADAFTVALVPARPVEALTVLAGPGTTGEVQARAPGGEWRTLGALDPAGWTQVAAHGARAAAVRVTGEAGGVRRLVPWFADEPPAHLAVGPATADAETGGAPLRVTASVAAMGPAAVQGALSARAPRGITVRLPREVAVARGTRRDVPVEVDVAPGTPSGDYRVPLSFGDQEVTLTVRARPRTGGPDLIAGAMATSSGDAGPGSPARAASDGRPATRWSAPPEDGGPWWQAELAGPARVGLVVLQWQGARPAHPAVRVSSDGRSWRTAATVDAGGSGGGAGAGGGRERIRVDARGVRFLRIQAGEAGPCSLWSVEAYAVRG